MANLERVCRKTPLATFCGLDLRQVPEAKPETCQNTGPLVLPELPEPTRRTRIEVWG